MDQVTLVYEHRCPPELCNRVGEQVTVRPHCRDGVLHLSRIICAEARVELWEVNQR